MRARIDQAVLYLHHQDVPPYKKAGSLVRNSYFWALRSIADRAGYHQDWEFSESVWIALGRLLMAFARSGYLGYRETLLEFVDGEEIPPPFTLTATWIDEPDWQAERPSPRG
ncbi:MAG: hypothetical protein KGQ93_00070 [Cyanobacteria bacterium REEB459]|nr:hypothetical protein [Cyanobacteria bacterium REEB459]